MPKETLIEAGHYKPLFFATVVFTCLVMMVFGYTLFQLQTSIRNDVRYQIQSDIDRRFSEIRVSLDSVISDSDSDANQVLSVAFAETEAEINNLRSRLESTEKESLVSAVSNPRMGSKRANCPDGYFVSGIEGSRGVSGKYGVDGISELRVTCTALLREE